MEHHGFTLLVTTTVNVLTKFSDFALLLFKLFLNAFAFFKAVFAGTVPLLKLSVSLFKNVVGLNVICSSNFEIIGLVIGIKLVFGGHFFPCLFALDEGFFFGAFSRVGEPFSGFVLNFGVFETFDDSFLLDI